jgi:hypothetical protein
VAAAGDRVAVSVMLVPEAVDVLEELSVVVVAVRPDELFVVLLELLEPQPIAQMIPIASAPRTHLMRNASTFMVQTSKLNSDSVQ